MFCLFSVGHDSSGCSTAAAAPAVADGGTEESAAAVDNVSIMLSNEACENASVSSVHHGDARILTPPEGEQVAESSRTSLVGMAVLHVSNAAEATDNTLNSTEDQQRMVNINEVTLLAAEMAEKALKQILETAPFLLASCGCICE